ncbi:2-dehydro-3-deoxy-6-phosphogalactonate aldolase [Methylobrevis albus]|uniref:2-dehydro-3-deoxy-6-phosphogalactonate aldolase n=1 Tax=Methylobrevis albus TaxID=2793297 RepID=A0A931I0T3_9HYPH|nr:2-dehydro-3-deoxy-6-phosphogalactonate aldolase [Methylobrevis albus]MBH0238080.1 2-dehydro-3-deoxy-6-phosphogalactonate aldolase [Methylobrevis albus]
MSPASSIPILPVPWPALRRNLVAILRGITPEEIGGIGVTLIEAGFEAIEVPLNSPDPLASIGRLAAIAPPHVLVGAGTVLSVADVDRVAAAGGRLIVSPNADPAVIGRARDRGLVAMPGVFTATEAFAALAAGASALKFFPANVLGPAGIAALKAVLPKDVLVGAVGGVAEGDFAAYATAGCRAFGLGSGLYKPGDEADTVGARARRAVAAWDAVFPG